MSIFHYKAILKEVLDNNTCVYTYYPDEFMAEDITGEFSLQLDTFESTITLSADAEANGLVSMDKRCVYELTFVIKKRYEENGELPGEVIIRH